MVQVEKASWKQETLKLAQDLEAFKQTTAQGFKQLEKALRGRADLQRVADVESKIIDLINTQI